MSSHLYRVAPVFCLVALAVAVIVQWAATARALPAPVPVPSAGSETPADRPLMVSEYRRLEAEARLRDIQEQQDWARLQDQYRAFKLRRFEDTGN